MKSTLSTLSLASFLGGCTTSVPEADRTQEISKQTKETVESVAKEIKKDRNVSVTLNPESNAQGIVTFRATPGELYNREDNGEDFSDEYGVQDVETFKAKIERVTACHFDSAKRPVDLKVVEENIKAGLKNYKSYYADRLSMWDGTTDCSRFIYQDNPTSFTVEAFPGADGKATLVKGENGFLQPRNEDLINTFMIKTRRKEHEAAFVEAQKKWSDDYGTDLIEEYQMGENNDQKLTVDYMYVEEMKVDVDVMQICIDVDQKEINCGHSPDAFIRTSEPYVDLQVSTFSLGNGAQLVSEIPGISEMPGSIVRAYNAGMDRETFARITNIDMDRLTVTGQIWYSDYAHDGIGSYFRYNTVNTLIDGHDVFLIDEFKDLSYAELSDLMRKNAGEEVHSRACQAKDSSHGAFHN